MVQEIPKKGDEYYFSVEGKILLAHISEVDVKKDSLGTVILCRIKLQGIQGDWITWVDSTPENQERLKEWYEG
ncbi:hypothetical protein KTR10_01815 [Candidatus Kaiserbacteria bacterium]|nr:hypothetical protein [Candidatus Kaiserbacteria bacterium]